MSQPYVGQVIAVGFNFVPANWLPCDGSLVPISQFDVLYNLIGTTYGGDGVTTFGLPDLRGRSPVNAGQGGGLSNYILGQLGGSETVTVTTNQIGSHNHTMNASSQLGATSVPAGNLALAQPSTNTVALFSAGPGNTTLAPNAVGNTGSGQPHENRQPYQTLNYIISPFGIYPSQN